MRADAIKAETMLWNALSGSKLEGLKFKRQEPIDGYILDFVCFSARLIIEVDGGQHAECARDVERDHYFESQGFRTVRFWNSASPGLCIVRPFLSTPYFFTHPLLLN